MRTSEKCVVSIVVRVKHCGRIASSEMPVIAAGEGNFAPDIVVYLKQ